MKNTKTNIFVLGVYITFCIKFYRRAWLNYVKKQQDNVCGDFAAKLSLYRY